MNLKMKMENAQTQIISFYEIHFYLYIYHASFFKEKSIRNKTMQRKPFMKNNFKNANKIKGYFHLSDFF